MSTTKKNIIETAIDTFAAIAMYLYSYLVTLLMKEKEIITGFIILLFVDTILGIAAAIKEKRKITSPRFLAGISFKLTLLFVVSVIGIILKYYADIDIIKPLVFMGAVSESISIKEKIEILYGTNLVDKLIEKLRKAASIHDKVKNAVNTENKKKRKSG